METVPKPAAQSNVDPDTRFGESQSFDSSSDSKLTGLRNLPPEKITQYAENRKEERDAEVVQAMEAGGEVAATGKKWEQIQSDLADTLGYFDESGAIDQVRLDVFLHSNVGEALKKLHLEKLKNDLKLEKRYTSDSEITVEEQKSLEEQAQSLADTQRSKSWKELTFDAADQALNSVDAQTFIMALIGNDVGEGRYGASRLRSEKSSEADHPGAVISVALEKYRNKPGYIQELISTGLRYCNKSEGDLSSSIDLSNTIAELALDPLLAKKFLWGVYNRLGQPALAGKMSSEQAQKIVKDLADQVKLLSLEGRPPEQAPDTASPSQQSTSTQEN